MNQQNVEGQKVEKRKMMEDGKNSGKKAKSSIPLRGLPAELLNELFVSLSLENAFDILAKMPNVLLARNVQKMINDIKEALKNNKFNETDCGPKLVISDDELVAKHSGPNEWNCARAILPVPSFKLRRNKPIIAFYFEVQILTKSQWDDGIFIGFCDQEFLLENSWLGRENNSIGIFHKGGIYIERSYIKFGNDIDQDFKKGDVIGLGIIHQPNSSMEIFNTWNGKLFAKVVELPKRFLKLVIFPAVSLRDIDESVRVIFDNNKWCFKKFKHALE